MMLFALLLLPHFDLSTYERARVLTAAEAALNAEPRTITTVANPRSPGGTHDFSSEGDYWWPDPKNPAGPYIRRDGLTNPDNFVAHRMLMSNFARDTDALMAAYRLTHDERYAAAAVRLLHAWFVDPATRMNPNLQYAQSVKGICTGRSIGIIDTVRLTGVALGVIALRGSHALTPDEDAAITGWFRDYLHWIRTHPYGIEESNAGNNHGTCWVLQAACFARLAGDEAVLADCRHRFKQILLPHQMAADGSFPLELARTKPYSYSIFNLDMMTATGREDWLKLWERLPADPTDEEIRRNFPIRQPVLWVP